MLFTCPECQLQVSDKALTCPHCGYPLVKPDSPKISNKKSKPRRIRLPNGFGSIVEIKGKNLRNPFRASVCVGTKADGTPDRKLLKPQAYFKTYNDAYAALVEYNKNPYDLDDDITVEKLYDKWTEEYFKTLKSDSYARTITSAWAYCSSVYKLRAKDLRPHHIKYCIDNGTVTIRGEPRTPSYNMKDRIKSVFNLMLDYAVEYEIVDKNCSRTFGVSNEIKEGMEETKRPHLSFKDDEMRILKENINMPTVDVIIIQCYMGWRPQELGLIEISNVHLDEGYIVGGIKSNAGFNRRVPIHPYIRPLIEQKYQEAIACKSKYLLTCTDGKTHKANVMLTYDKYRVRYTNIMSILGLNPDHRPHDPRKQFVTMCKKYKVDNFAIKMMVGHKIDDITEAVYTDRPISWLIEEINKIE